MLSPITPELTPKPALSHLPAGLLLQPEEDVKKTLELLKAELARIYDGVRKFGTVIVQAQALYRAKVLHEKVYGKPQRGGDHRSATFKNQKTIVDFWSEAEKRTGWSLSKLKMWVVIGQNLSPIAAKLLEGSKYENSSTELYRLVMIRVVTNGKVYGKPRPFAEQDKRVKLALNKDKCHGTVKGFKHAEIILERKKLLHEHCHYLFDVRFQDYLEFLKSFPDASVDMILSDPPYEGEHLGVFEPLAKEAKRILKPGASLIIMVGQYYLAKILMAIEPHLPLYWAISVNYTGNTKQVYARKVACSWKPMLWFRNGEYPKGDPHADLLIRDSVSSTPPKKLHSPHEQSIDEFMHVLKSLSLPGDLVIDPFTGGGTTGEAALRNHCRFAGCDNGTLENAGTTWIDLSQRRLERVAAELNGEKPTSEPVAEAVLMLPPPAELVPVQEIAASVANAENFQVDIAEI